MPTLTKCPQIPLIEKPFGGITKQNLAQRITVKRGIRPLKMFKKWFNVHILQTAKVISTKLAGNISLYQLIIHHV